MRRLTTMLALCLVTICAAAQDNPYKINDTLYTYFQRAQKLRSSRECLAVSDSMYAKAVRMGDLKAQCLAKTIPTSYYFHTRDLDSLMTVCEELKEISRKNEYSQYIFFAYGQQVTCLLNNGKIEEAQKVLDEMKDEATRMGDMFGLSSCLIKNGQLHYLRQNYRKSREFYLQAAELLETAVQDQSPSAAYLFASDCYIVEGNFADALTLAEKARDTKLYISDKHMINILDRIAECHYMLQNDSAFVANVKAIRAIEAKSGKNYNSHSRRSEILWLARAGKTEEAISLLKAEHEGISINKLAERIHVAAGDYKSAVTEADSCFIILTRINQKVNNDEMAEMSAILETEKLKADKAILEQNRQKAMTRFVVIIALLLACCIIYLIYNAHRMSRKNSELEAAKEKAEHSERMKTLFVQNMSHEIRTPLNSVVGFSQLLAEDDSLSQEEREEYSRIIGENADSLATLIDDILNISDIESGKYRLNLAKVSVNEICRDSNAAIATRVPAGVELKFESEIPDDYTVTTDKLRVMQILTNLLTNACKHTVEGTIVTSVSLAENPGRVTFAVKDSGAGIPADKAETVFGRFEKLDIFKPGNGLGLSICRMIADLLGGEIHLDTANEDGARFVFSMPISN